MQDETSIIEQFVVARDYLNDNLEEMINVYLCGIWDPLIEVVLLKELKKLIDNDLERIVPGLPVSMRPKYSYRIFQEDKEKTEVELSIQQYLNKDSGLKFLGNYQECGVPYDLYCAPYYDGMNDFLFYARYGHVSNNCLTGANDAKSEYYLGIITPLSVAYGMAVYDGYINE